MQVVLVVLSQRKLANIEDSTARYDHHRLIEPALRSLLMDFKRTLTIIELIRRSSSVLSSHIEHVMILPCAQVYRANTPPLDV